MHMNKEKVHHRVQSEQCIPFCPMDIYVGTVNGLADWFADTVTADGKEYTFFWNKMPQTAHQIGYRSGVFIRFRWDEEDVDTKSYFEFRINVIELTGDVILEITDYAYPDEKRDSIDLWNRQISSLSDNGWEHKKI